VLFEQGGKNIRIFKIRNSQPLDLDLFANVLVMSRQSVMSRIKCISDINLSVYSSFQQKKAFDGSQSSEKLRGIIIPTANDKYVYVNYG
jgi:hypothetical protein